ncbi:hypothetical protein NKR23_g267 [Pleurostoma richardsiae]|uniref:Ketoreductase domain-containing protein n=1 Tax=Pleurostoma richardsiae TaxID=41990 RepID=A0AA38SG29_9PEZI|nr:hypothetical protein NKR23_g267 [Pleurostoma richardsiae]
MSQTVFITGANSGIGLATTKAFLSNGWNVVGTARKPAAAEELQQLARDSDGKLLIVQLDLTAEATFQPALDAAVAQFDKVDVLVNNAGYGHFGVMEAQTVDDYRRQFEVNVFGPIGLTKLFVPHFRATRDAHSPATVIYVSSGAAHFGLPLFSPYMASKAALNLFAETVSYELAQLSPPVTVKIVVPHGGVQSTNFLKTAQVASDFREDAEGKAKRAATEKLYGAYAAKVLTVFGGMAGASMAVEEPAMKIYEAVTDGTNKLRYFISGKDGGRDLRARMSGMREGEDLDAADDRYMSSMRGQFP